MKAVAFDFDGTMAATFEDSPSGMNVAVAYKKAIRSVMGQNVLEAYELAGGLRNRAPREVVEELAHALAKEAEISELTERLIAEKIRFLADCVGERFEDGSAWPRPMPGFCNYWRRLSADPGFARVIISSGHTAFINAWLDANELSRADSMVTFDDLSNLREPYSKPDARVFERAMCPLWTRHLGIRPVAYYGDDPVYDGLLAQNAGVPFYLFDRSGTSSEENAFSHWSQAPIL